MYLLGWVHSVTSVSYRRRIGGLRLASAPMGSLWCIAARNRLRCTCKPWARKWPCNITSPARGWFSLTDATISSSRESDKFGGKFFILYAVIPNCFVNEWPRYLKKTCNSRNGHFQHQKILQEFLGYCLLWPTSSSLIAVIKDCKKHT